MWRWPWEVRGRKGATPWESWVPTILPGVRAPCLHLRSGGLQVGAWVRARTRAPVPWHSPAILLSSHLFSPCPLQPWPQPRSGHRPHSTGQFRRGVTARTQGAQVGGSCCPKGGRCHPLRACSPSLLFLRPGLRVTPSSGLSCPDPLSQAGPQALVGLLPRQHPMGAPQHRCEHRPCVAGGIPAE